MIRRARLMMAAVAAIMIVPWGVVFVLFNGAALLDPGRFLERYAEFVGTLVAVGLSFFLVNMYWHGKEAQLRTTRLLGLFLARMRRTLTALRELEAQLGRHIENSTELMQADARIEELKRELAEAIAYMDAVETQTWTEKLGSRDTSLMQSWTGGARPAVSALLSTPQWSYSKLLLLEAFGASLARAIEAVSSVLREGRDAAS